MWGEFPGYFVKWKKKKAKNIYCVLSFMKGKAMKNMYILLKQFWKYLNIEYIDQMSKCVDSVRSLNTGPYYEESKKYIGNRQKQEGSSLKVFWCK